MRNIVVRIHTVCLDCCWYDDARPEAGDVLTRYQFVLGMVTAGRRTHTPITSIRAQLRVGVRTKSSTGSVRVVVPPVQASQLHSRDGLGHGRVSVGGPSVPPGHPTSVQLAPSSCLQPGNYRVCVGQCAGPVMRQVPGPVHHAGPLASRRWKGHIECSSCARWCIRIRALGRGWSESTTTVPRFRIPHSTYQLSSHLPNPSPCTGQVE